MTNLNNLRVRNAQLEAQLQQYTMEFDRVNQRNQVSERQTTITFIIALHS